MGEYSCLPDDLVEIVVEFSPIDTVLAFGRTSRAWLSFCVQRIISLFHYECDERGYNFDMLEGDLDLKKCINILVTLQPTSLETYVHLCVWTAQFSGKYIDRALLYDKWNTYERNILLGMQLFAKNIGSDDLDWQYFDAAIEQQPDNMLGRLARGNCQLLSPQDEIPENYYTDLIMCVESNFQTYISAFKLAMKYMSVKKWDMAHKYLKIANADKPVFFSGMTLLCYSSNKMRLWDESLQYMNAAISHALSHRQSEFKKMFLDGIHRDRAILHIKCRKYKEAMADCRLHEAERKKKVKDVDSPTKVQFKRAEQIYLKLVAKIISKLHQSISKNMDLVEPAVCSLDWFLSNICCDASSPTEEAFAEEARSLLNEARKIAHKQFAS